MKLYVSGPIAHWPDDNRPAFARACQVLFMHGYETLNPFDIHQAEIYAAEHRWEKALSEDLVEFVTTCQGVALLPFWFASRGATLEVYIASQLRMPILTVREWTAIDAQQGVMQVEEAREVAAKHPEWYLGLI